LLQAFLVPRLRLGIPSWRLCRPNYLVLHR
jgi:hypothetical protein